MYEMSPLLKGSDVLIIDNPGPKVGCDQTEI